MYLSILLSSLLAQPAEGIVPLPLPSEVLDMQRWADARFGGAALPHEVGQVRLISGHDAMQVNHHRNEPLEIAGRSFDRGFYLHAPAELLVSLPGPGATFEALLGVDTNFQTSGGRGSVEFAIEVGGEERFRSPVIHEGEGPVPCTVALEGATSFTVRVLDGGDGIACDQAAMVSPKVTLAEGNTIPLDALPRAGWLDPFYGDTPPFSFRYGGRPSGDLLPQWPVTHQETKLDAERLQREQVWTDPETGLRVHCTSITYRDFPTVEWTVWLENTGETDSPLLEDVRGLDITPRQTTPEAPPLLHHNKGTVVTTVAVPEGKHDFEPLETRLKTGEALRFVPPQGRPSAGEWPYFNLTYPDGGIIIAVGWPGQWAAEFETLDTTTTRIQAGQATTEFRLRPGERVRTPLMAMQFWQGPDWLRGQNIWRRWMLAHNTPAFHGKPLQPMTAGFCGYYAPGALQISETLERAFIDRYHEEGLTPDGWWIDAGWYQCDGNWTKTGTWAFDRERFPNGAKPCFDHARGLGMEESILWLEPERVVEGTWLTENHREWLLDWEGIPGTHLLNLGDTDALAWVIDKVGGILERETVTVYRQDFNMPPVGYWLQADAEGRRGITENHYVTGYLAFWDALLERIPGLLIDTCASGGHRDDLETLRRSVPLWRTDWPWEAIAQQGQTYGISLWVPYHGTGVVDGDDYTIRSDMAPFFLESWDMRRDDLDYDRLRALMKEWRETADCRLGDFWPLTEYSLGEGNWMAWQYDRPDVGRGLIQVFRRTGSIYRAADLRLRNLAPEASYAVYNYDTGKTRSFLGRVLMEDGLPLDVTTPRTAVTLRYTRK